MTKTKIMLADLRVGNYHQTAEISIPRMQIQSIKVDDKSFSAITAFGIHLYAEGEMEFIPIPLTEVWIKQFGIIDGGKFPANEYFQIHHSQAGFKEYGLYFEDEFTGVYIKYVHELQNLYFALTGEELLLAAENEKK